MRVAILGDTLRIPLRGIGMYTQRIVEALASEFPQNEYVLVRPDSASYASWNGATIHVPVKGGSLSRVHEEMWGAWAGPRAALRREFDVILSPGNIKSFLFVPAGRAKRVMTIHDLTPRLLPHTHKWKIRQEFRWLLSTAVRRTDGLLCDSRATLQDLLHLVPDAAARPVEVAHLGADRSFFSAGARPPPSPEIAGPYFLCVGSIEPRKNLVTVLHAFARYRAAGGEARLVAVGPGGWRNKDFYDLLDALKLRDHIHFTGYVPEDQMPSLYAHALALLYPSSYEGFGLPIVEAMAAGCPVVTSRVSSLPEVGGDAAVFIDPTDVDALAKAMDAIIQDETLRARLSEAGRARALGFTWPQTARRTQAFLELVAAGNASSVDAEPAEGA